MDYNVYFSVAKIEASYTSKEQTNRDFTESSYISSFFKAFFWHFWHNFVFDRYENVLKTFC